MVNLILDGAMVHPISSDSSRTKVLINNNGKVWQVGDDVKSSTGKVIRLRHNWHITPTLIDAHSHIGLNGFYGQDECNDDGEPISPGLSIIDSYNVFSDEIPLALEAGVGASCILPGSGSIIGGQAAVVKMWGDSINAVLVDGFVGMKAAIDDNSSHGAEFDTENNYTKMGIALKVRDFFLRASRYIKSSKKDMSPSEFSVHYEAINRMGEEGLPFRIHCHYPSDIETSIRLFLDELEYPIVLEHATYADIVLDIITSKNIPVVYGPYPMALRGTDRFSINKSVPALLEAAGVKVAFMTDHDVMPAWSLQLTACEAVKHGMSRTGALRAMTLSAAEICGVSDRLGSLSRGRDADLVIWNKHPLDFYAKPLGVMIDGKFRYVSDDIRFREALDEANVKYD